MSIVEPILGASQPMTQIRSDATQRETEPLPEQRLMIAMIRDAIRRVERYRLANDKRSKRFLAQEIQWLRSDAANRLYDFVRICEALDLEPNAVRRSLGVLVSRRAKPAFATGDGASQVSATA